MNSPPKITNDFYTMSRCGNLVSCQILGSWDDRVTKSFFSDVDKMVSKISSADMWAMLADCTQWGLNTPEAQDLFSSRAKKPKTKPILTHLAIVVGDSALRKWQAETQTEESETFITNFFNNIEEAKQWLESVGFGIDVG